MKFLRSAGAYICGYVGFGPEQSAQVHEFVNAKLVGFSSVHAFRRAALPEVIGARARFTDAVAPVIAVGETASGPAEVGRTQELHVVDELFADSIDVGDV